MPAPPAVGQRLAWAELPGDVRRGIEGVLGAPVIRTESQAGGFSPGTADRVRTSTGRRAFVKAVSPDQNPDSPDIHRREADYLAALSVSPRVPRLLGRYDDGYWIAIVMEEIGGACPSVPWSIEHVEVAMSALGALATDLTPNPIVGLEPVSEGFSTLFAGWRRLQEDPPENLDSWIGAHLDYLIELSESTLERLDGDTVVHCDVRADNLLVRADGSMVVVDWPWALSGADWLDRFMLLINIDLYGGHDVEGLAGRYLGDVEPELITGALAGLCAYFVDAARQPPAPGLPTLREFQRAQGDSTLAWLRRRLAEKV